MTHQQAVKGDYTLSVQVHSYINPTNGCAVCGNNCCDQEPVSPNCNGGRACDNEFFFCVRPLEATVPSLATLRQTDSERSVQSRAGLLQCLQPPAAFRSSTVMDGAAIDFTGPLFLGIPNPMTFQVTASAWEVSNHLPCTAHSTHIPLICVHRVFSCILMLLIETAQILMILQGNSLTPLDFA